MNRTAAVCGSWLLLMALPGAQRQPPKYPSLPSETPRAFTPVTEGFDYVRRDVMILMMRR